ncbi:MAG: hypothetical protein ACRBF0_06440 [Calditrichia bacterium]
MLSVKWIFRSGFFLLLILLVGASSCARQSISSLPAESGKTVFFNSFEVPGDTKSWYWAGSYRFTKDVPPGGGDSALRIRGIQTLPAASFISKPLRGGGYFTLECWGKNLDIGGTVQLATISNYEITETIQLGIFEEEWEHLESTDTLYVPPNTSLMLTMQAGGPVDGTIFVDNLAIRKVR